MASLKRCSSKARHGCATNARNEPLRSWLCRGLAPDHDRGREHDSALLRSGSAAGIAPGTPSAAAALMFRPRAPYTSPRRRPRCASIRSLRCCASRSPCFAHSRRSRPPAFAAPQGRGRKKPPIPELSLAEAHPFLDELSDVAAASGAARGAPRRQTSPGSVPGRRWPGLRLCRPGQTREYDAGSDRPQLSDRGSLGAEGALGRDEPRPPRGEGKASHCRSSASGAREASTAC